MEKKAYITPVVEVHRLHVANGIMLTGSNTNQNILGNGGDTGSNNISSGDSKESGSWSSIWD